MPRNGRSPFPDVLVAPAERRHMQDVADQMLDRTLRSYDQFLLDRQQLLSDRNRWKEVRTEYGAAIYLKRSSSSEDVLSGANAAWRGMSDPMVFVGLGQCSGTVEDMLLALAAGDTYENAVSCAYLGQRLAGNCVLESLRQRTAEDPLSLLVLQWVAYQPPPIIDKIVHTRDYVFITSKGITRRESGDIIGYVMMQSVDLPACPSLKKSHSFVRGRLSLGCIFVQRPNATVEVFFETFVEANGRVMAKLSQYVSSLALTSFFHLDETAKRIKLQWCIDMAQRTAMPIRRGPAHGRSMQRSDSSPGIDCADCAALLVGASFSPDVRCSLCRLPMCPSCRRTVELKDVTSELKIVVTQVDVCVSCLARAERVSAVEIARARVLQRGGQFKGGLRSLPLRSWSEADRTASSGGSLADGFW